MDCVILCFEGLFQEVLKKQHNSVDIWRYLNPDKRQLTMRQMSLSLFSRLDYWLMSKKVRMPFISIDGHPPGLKGTKTFIRSYFYCKV